MDGEGGGGGEVDEPLRCYVFFALGEDAVDLTFGESAADGVMVVPEEGFYIV